MEVHLAPSSGLRRSFLSQMRPPPRLKLSTWLEANLVLPDADNSAPGRLRLYSYQREIADEISNPEIERVSIVKAVRIGFSMLLTGAIGNFVANDPSPILLMLPTSDDARDTMVSQIEPTFEASPALASAISGETDERNTLLSKRFPGGSLKLVAARSPRNLRRHTVRILMADEADAMEAGAEGNPIKLGEKRTLTFANRKIIIGSTPVFEETSQVLRAYAQSDQRVFEVPCPHCGVYFEILWRNIEWPENEPERAACRCPSCSELISETKKPAMVAAGAWRAMRPEVKGHAGFRLNALVSLLHNAGWGKLAEEFLKAKDDPAELQVFTNTILAQGWSTPSMIDDGALSSRAEAFDLNAVPEEVLFITVGVDVQDDRLEVTTCGWTRIGECLVLGHEIIWGSFAEDSTWDDLGDFLRTTWKHPFGGTLKVDAAVVDASDGDHYDAVMNFCVPKISRRIFPGKGMFGARPGFAMAKGKKVANRLAIIGVDTLKGQIFNRLQHGRGIRFSHDLEPIYYEQLASEKLVIRYSRGQPSRRFERIGRARAEALDCLVYAHAARQSFRMNFDAREAELRSSTTAVKKSISSLLPK